MKIRIGQLKEMARKREDPENFLRRLIWATRPKRSLLAYLRRSSDPEADIRIMLRSGSWHDDKMANDLIDVALELGCKLDPDLVDALTRTIFINTTQKLGLSSDPNETYSRIKSKQDYIDGGVIQALTKYNLVWDHEFMEAFLSDLTVNRVFQGYATNLLKALEGTPWMDHPAVTEFIARSKRITEASEQKDREPQNKRRAFVARLSHVRMSQSEAMAGDRIRIAADPEKEFTALVPLICEMIEEPTWIILEMSYRLYERGGRLPSGVVLSALDYMGQIRPASYDMLALFCLACHEPAVIMHDIAKRLGDASMKSIAHHIIHIINNEPNWSLAWDSELVRALLLYSSTASIRDDFFREALKNPEVRDEIQQALYDEAGRP